MAKEWRRLLISSEQLEAASDARVPLGDRELHYLRRVLRLRSGDGFAVVDGQGRLWQACLAHDSALLQQPLNQPLQLQAPSELGLQLAVAWPRRDGELLLRMATELGIDRIQPLMSDRSVTGERWNSVRTTAIVQEAVEQCERLWMPDLAAPLGATSWLAEWGHNGGDLALLATTRHGDLPLLLDRLEGFKTAQAPVGESVEHSSRTRRVVSLAIGPEGGWSPAEESLAMAKGWQAVSLGPTILRTATAAVGAAAVLCQWRSSCGTSPRPLT